jgi:S-adenosylmethionine:tRNA ribosyltransferase-isomerase
MHPKNISIQDYTYNLPIDKIANYPLETRDNSKLLVYKNKTIEQDIYKNIASHLPNNSFVIFNNTKVIEARLLFETVAGKAIEIFCLEPHQMYVDISMAMAQQQKIVYKCLVGGAKKWKQNEPLVKEIISQEGSFFITANCIEKLQDCFAIELSWSIEQATFAQVLQLAGQMPLPPYINRNVEENDSNTYQTIYAKNKGSVAAPTAGLHFTNDILQSFSAKNISTNFVTLHVGAGTFKPVKASTMQEHVMHSEYIDVSLLFLISLLENLSQTIVCVGTTSLRTIESLYWIGVKIINSKHKNLSKNEEENLLIINQWDAYEMQTTATKQQAIEAIVDYLQEHNLERLLTKTQIIIAPSYKLQIANVLITNFHQPQSTLILLVAAIVNNSWKDIYNYALENDFRFLSYGDGCILFNE